MSTKKDAAAARIVAAALSILKREGVLALTQPRVAKAAGIRQSHLTYYFPTRGDLVAAVAEAVAATHLAGLGDALAGAKDRRGLAVSLARSIAPAKTRLLLALVIAADGEKKIRAPFRQLTQEIRARIAASLARLGLAADDETLAVLHALGIGLAVLELARGGTAARRDIKAALGCTVAQLKPRKRKKRQRS